MQGSPGETVAARASPKAGARFRSLGRAAAVVVVGCVAPKIGEQKAAATATPWLLVALRGRLAGAARSAAFGEEQGAVKSDRIPAFVLSRVSAGVAAYVRWGHAQPGLTRSTS